MSVLHLSEGIGKSECHGCKIPGSTRGKLVPRSLARSHQIFDHTFVLQHQPHTQPQITVSYLFRCFPLFVLQKNDNGGPTVS